jgi:hypothetical protein
MQFITLLDYLLLPFFLGLIYLIANTFRNRYYPQGHPWRKYFLPALHVKIFGALFIGLVYQYYYGGGDTAYYFYQAKVVNRAFGDDPFKGIMLLLHIPTWYDGEYQVYISQMEWYGGLNMYLVIALAAFVNIFTLSTFLPTSIVFAFISFWGTWALFRTFAQIYPHLLRQVAVALLFIPSSFIWGSGIFKDTLCVAALGWLTHSSFQMLIQKNFRPANICTVIISFYILAVIKIYILLAFLPALALWFVFTYSHRLNNKLARNGIKVALVALTLLSFVVLSSRFSSELGGYSLENISKTAEITRSYVYGESGADGSGYDLGEIDGSIGGLLRAFPVSLGTALYRPFLWESKKLIVLMNAAEATLFLLLSLKILLVVGPRRIYKIISADPNIQFLLVFTIIFGFAVGLTSGNFGSLSRYRIPCLPMFGLALMLIYYKSGARRKLMPQLNF